MALQTEPFDQDKIDKLRMFLDNMSQRGQGRPFEIFVDNLKVVPKTTDMGEFEQYELYISEDTHKIRILIYYSDASPRNDQYVFTLKQTAQAANGLNGLEGKGLGEVIQEKLNERDREHELAKLREKLEATEQQLEESEQYGEELEKRIAEMEAGQYKKMVSMGDIAGLVLNGWLKQNPHIIAKLPGGETLAGLMQQQPQLTPATEETEASYERRQDAEDMNANQKGWVSFGRQLEQGFTRPQLDDLLAIIQALNRAPQHISDILELLNINPSNPNQDHEQTPV